ncbi:PREDICTED: short-chain dehydrogenase TIC 32, chloroplastic [Tarenaya hassleriana]|uniref:short-chain dehydrogenase TIC 32, chloroplastic n=1 Tax=Tarenaya hassleriana TaxID=28532 RepID=UPI00053CA9AE|nr:PREDICTED: short-chain dehydrogenase TIC 32, chloroplastic [Tarenaya hassleriana]
MGIYEMATGREGRSGFGSASTAEDVTHGIHAHSLTAIVTGGTSGIGLETARVLAKRGVHVIVAARNVEAAKETKDIILQSNPNSKIDFLPLDLSSVKSVRSFVRHFLSLNLPLNILINNAGVMFCPFQLSEDGIEMQFAVNHIGHFVLTKLLLDKMKSTAEETGTQGRIVNLSSIAHFFTYTEGIKFHDLSDLHPYSDKRAYGQSKLANILHSNALSRRLQEEGANITVNSVHPGLITTNLFRHSGLLISTSGLRVFIYFLLVSHIYIHTHTFFLWKNIPQGAATTCYVALHPSLKGVTGKYFSDCNVITPSKFAADEILADKLWDFSTKLVNSLPP